MSDTQFYGRFDNSTNKQPSETRSTSNAYSIAKVFGYMFIWLLVTTVITFGLAFFFNYLLTHATTVAEKDKILTAEVVVAIVAGISLLIVSIVNTFVILRGRHNIAVPATIYSVLMGVLLGVISSIITEYFVNGWFVIGVSFGATTLVFGAMALIGLLSKSRLNALPLIAGGIFFGMMILSIVLLIMMLVPSLRVYYNAWYWVIMLGIFAAVMLITIWDIRNIKTMAERGALTKNMSMYLAFNLYVDFVYILMRILYIVLIIAGKAKK